MLAHELPGNHQRHAVGSFQHLIVLPLIGTPEEHVALADWRVPMLQLHSTAQVQLQPQAELIVEWRMPRRRLGDARTGDGAYQGGPGEFVPPQLRPECSCLRRGGKTPALEGVLEDRFRRIYPALNGRTVDGPFHG